MKILVRAIKPSSGAFPLKKPETKPTTRPMAEAMVPARKPTKRGTEPKDNLCKHISSHDRGAKPVFLGGGLVPTAGKLFIVIGSDHGPKDGEGDDGQENRNSQNDFLVRYGKVEVFVPFPEILACHNYTSPEYEWRTRGSMNM